MMNYLKNKIRNKITFLKIFVIQLVIMGIISCTTTVEKNEITKEENPVGQLEVYAELDQSVGNIAYTIEGELVWSHHPFFKPEIRVVKYDASTKKTTPFPNIEWNTVQKDNENYLDDVLGIRNDSKGIVWMLDMGTRNNIKPKLVGWNTSTNTLERVYNIPAPTTLTTSQPQDFVIDYTHSVIVIADEDIARGGDGSKGALIVVNMNNGESRRLLESHISTIPDEASPIKVDGKVLSANANGTPLLVAADGITLDKEDYWLYYAPLNGKKVYRIKMIDIIDNSLTDTELRKRVETYSSKENNGGISIDTNNNLYLTNVENHSVGFVNGTNQSLSVFAQHDKMLWPDGVSYNKDGYMYIGAAQVHLGDVFNDGKDLTKKPFYVFRYKPVVKGIFGR